MEREREKERGVHGRLFLGGPCNEVHGMLLVIIDTKRRRDVCLYIYIFVYIRVCNIFDRAM